MQRFFEQNRERTWITQYWNDVSDLESGGSNSSDLHALYSRESTMSIDAFVRTPPREILLNATIMATEAGFESAKRAFCRICEEYSSWLRHYYPDIAHSLHDQEERVTFVRDPLRVVEVVCKYNPQFDTVEGRKAAARFPDVLAVGRISRLVIWYAIRRILGDSRKFENNWDDASYAFAASYTGWLATNDDGLIKAVNAVYPHVQIWNRTAA